MKNIIFIAPPAAGKGTLSNNLKNEFGYVHISSGDILREAINTNSPLGQMIKDIMAKGNFVSDEIVINLIAQKLESLDGKPFILDGFPRTLNQATKLDELINKIKGDYLVIYLDISKEEAKKRIVGRLTCSCGKSYNTMVENLKPKVLGICDECGKPLIKREDDNEESFEIRYNSYLEKTKPIIDYYSQREKLVTIAADKSSKEVYENIIEVIK